MRTAFVSLAAALAWQACAVLANALPWTVDREWDAVEEQRFSEWISSLGWRSWKSTDALLHDSKANRLYEPSDDAITFRADCGDFPFVLRSYYAYKRRLPMILNLVDGGNYSTTPNRTVSQTDNLSFEGDVSDYFLALPEYVNTATFRTSPSDTDTAFYPCEINRGELRPGSVFYDPNGHALLVQGISKDGTVRFLDAHPDQTVTHTVLGPKIQWKSVSHAGGFLRFRPVRSRSGATFFENRRNRLDGFSTEQYAFGEDYYLQVRMRLADEKLDPIQAFKDYIRNDAHGEVVARVEAVEKGWAFAKTTPISIPSNLYQCEGPWEEYATPGRDIRLRLSFLAIPKQASRYVTLAKESPEALVKNARNPQRLARDLARAKERLFSKLDVSYVNSKGRSVRLTLEDIEKRLFRLSFDPNHAPELRWGATGRELRSVPKDSRYTSGYQRQESWRNRLKRKVGSMRPNDEDNPTAPPPHDLSAQLQDLVQTHDGAGRPRKFRLRIPFFSRP